MLSFKLSGNTVVEVSSEYQRDWLDRNDIKSLAHAEQIAFSATALGGPRYVAVDAGDHCSPRFDVIEAFKVGDEVSYAFNGDYYPDGKIVRMSASLRVIHTSGGHTYYRRRQSASWIQTGGTWTLVHGTINRRNPSF
jgi:hypothetical protein